MRVEVPVMKNFGLVESGFLAASLGLNGAF